MLKKNCFVLPQVVLVLIMKFFKTKSFFLGQNLINDKIIQGGIFLKISAKVFFSVYMQIEKIVQYFRKVTKKKHLILKKK